MELGVRVNGADNAAFPQGIERFFQKKADQTIHRLENPV